VIVYVSRKPQDLLHARDWFADPRLATVLADLEILIQRQEREWGPSVVFVECTFPIAGKVHSNQTDLVIAFKDRAALFEVKQGLGGTFLHEQVEGAVNQIGRQRNTLQEHLRREALDPSSIYCFLWAPHLKMEDLEGIVRQTRHADSLRHIIPTGGKSEFRGFKLPDGIPAYLPEALQWRLQSWAGGHSGTESVADALTRIFRRSQFAFGRPPLEFPNFGMLQRYLRAEIPQNNIELILDSTQVVGLRTDLSDRMLKILRQSRFIEMVGPAGVGKSSFIKETLIRLLVDGGRYGISSCILQRRETIRAILRSMAMEAGLLDMEQADRVDEEALLTLLGRSQLVLWIKDYDTLSRPAVSLLASKLGDVAKRHESYWIIESVVPSSNSRALDTHNCQLNVDPLRDNDLVKILNGHTKQKDRDINAVLAASGGIPRLAILRWTVDDPNEIPKSGRLDQYELFLLHLTREERPLVGAIAFILGESPLGTTLQLVESWCRAVAPAIGDIRRITRGVIEKASDARLISVEMFGTEELGADRIAQTLTEISEGEGTADDLVSVAFPASVRDALVGWLQILDPHFIEYFVRKIGPEDRRKWQELLHEVLLAGLEHNLSLSGVTLSLLTGDFEPFARSGFRQSSAFLPRLATWLGSTHSSSVIDAQGSNASYFRRWFAWLLEFYWDSTQTLAERGPAPWQLEPPDLREPLQVLLFNTLRARGMTYWNGRDYDWAEWSKAADEFWKSGEFDLWAESLIRQAQARRRPPYNQIESTWELMLRVLSEEDKLTAQAGRPMMCFHLLSFVINRKVWAGRLPSMAAEAPKLVPNLAQKMIRDGLVAENLNTIGSALFFYARWVELDNRPRSAVEVINYGMVMRFVERISPARRVQALITHASIHRHYLSQGGCSWDEFRDHAEEAMNLHERALASAIPARMLTLAGDALSYSGELLLKSLRFSSNPDDRTPDSEPALTESAVESQSVGHPAAAGRDAVWGTQAEQRDWLRQHLPSHLQTLESFLKSLSAMEKSTAMIGIPNRNLICNLYRYRALYTWLYALLVKPEAMEGISRAFQDTFQRLEETVSLLGHDDQLKVLQQTVSEILRTISYTAQELRQKEAVVMCSPILIGLLMGVGEVLPKGAKARRRSQLRKRGDKLLSLLSSLGVIVPTSLQTMFDAPALSGVCG
jgi:hypothetical protein